MNAKRKKLDFWDSKICKLEKSFASFLFLLMSIVILIDVIHRVFSRTPGRIASITASLFKMTPEVIDPWVDRIWIPSLVFLFSFLAIQSRSRSLNVSVSTLRTTIFSLVTTLVITFLLKGFTFFFPSGLVWSPYFGLSCLLWMGLLGASIATHHGQHLSLEMGSKIWPAKILPLIKKLCSLIVSIFCIFISVLAFLSVKDHYHDWLSSPEAGLIPSIEWPKWLVYLVIPYSFLMMGLRFLFRSLGLISDSHQNSIPIPEEPAS